MGAVIPFPASGASSNDAEPRAPALGLRCTQTGACPCLQPCHYTVDAIAYIAEGGWPYGSDDESDDPETRDVVAYPSGALVERRGEQETADQALSKRRVRAVVAFLQTWRDPGPDAARGAV